MATWLIWLSIAKNRAGRIGAGPVSSVADSPTQSLALVGDAEVIGRWIDAAHWLTSLPDGGGLVSRSLATIATVSGDARRALTLRERLRRTCRPVGERPATWRYRRNRSATSARIRPKAGTPSLRLSGVRFAGRGHTWRTVRSGDGESSRRGESRPGPRAGNTPWPSQLRTGAVCRSLKRSMDLVHERSERQGRRCARRRDDQPWEASRRHRCPAGRERCNAIDSLDLLPGCANLAPAGSPTVRLAITSLRRRPPPSLRIL